MIGFLNVYKPSGITSSAVVGKIRKKFKIKKIGHMGTLDPMAEGILPLAVGKATRMFDYFLNKDKTYIATFQFGYETTTLDALGERTKENSVEILENDIKEAISANFLGKISQVPPAFSAKHVDGMRAYDLARNGQNVELPPNEVEIFAFELLENLGNNTFKFKIKCGSGTYIRSLARDLGYALNTYGTMTALQRVQSGAFDLENSYTLESILQADSLLNFLIPIDKVFVNFKRIDLGDLEFTKLKNGLKLKTSTKNELSFLFNNDKLIGVAGIKEDELYIKTYLLEENDD